MREKIKKIDPSIVFLYFVFVSTTTAALIAAILVSP